jgi:hypothetical protein
VVVKVLASLERAAWGASDVGVAPSGRGYKAEGGVDATSSINEQRQRAAVEIALINTATSTTMVGATMVGTDPSPAH